MMFQAFMESSDDTTKTVSVVDGRVKSIEQAADTTHRLVDVIDNTVTQIDKRVEALKHGMGIRERKETELKQTPRDLDHVGRDSYQEPDNT
jgi:hypothetical protein